METYLLTDHGTVYRPADGAWIPADMQNADYLEFLEWKAAGNTPGTLPPPAPPTPIAA